MVLFSFKSQEISNVFGGKEDFASYGPVCALDICINGDTLMAGYEKGQLQLWDMTKMQPLKVISGILEARVICTKFYKFDRTNVIASDLAGNVHLISIQSMLWSVTFDNKRLVNRSINVYHDIDVLRSDYEPLVKNGVILIAMACYRNVIILSLEPAVSVLQQFDRPSCIVGSSIPCISWGLATCLNTSGTGSSYLSPAQLAKTLPTLCISQGKVI